MRLNPTVVLALALFALFFSIVLLGLHQRIAVQLVLLPIQMLVVIGLYTVAHDAVHRIASRRRWLNEAMLAGCGLVFLFDPWLYRRLHLSHHAHPHSANDPDRFSYARSLPGRLVRSVVLVGGYYVHAVRNLWSRPRWRMHVIASPLLPLVIAVTFASAGLTGALLMLWLIPLALAAGFLGFVLSSLPHDAERNQTRNLNPPPPIRWLLGNGHLHLAHHRFPRVAWYRLPNVWREHVATTAGDALIGRPAPDRSHRPVRAHHPA